MKARVKYNNEIIDVSQVGTKTHLFDINDVEFLDTPDYWTRLEHQYAGMAMQGIVNNNLLSSVLFKTGTTHEDYINEVVKVAKEYAHTLVEKMKEERK